MYYQPPNRHTHPDTPLYRPFAGKPALARCRLDSHFPIILIVRLNIKQTETFHIGNQVSLRHPLHQVASVSIDVHCLSSSFGSKCPNHLNKPSQSQTEQFSSSAFSFISFNADPQSHIHLKYALIPG